MSSTTFVTCARGWSPDCLGSTRLELHDDPGGDPELPVTAVLSSSWTLVETRDFEDERVEVPCCCECLSAVEAAWLLEQRAQVEDDMRGW